MSNWKEIRLKGKFIRAKEEKDEENEWVIPKFYYSFDIPEDDTVIHIGIHQEDDRVLGADRRRLLDITFVLFRGDDETEELEVIETPELIIERELQFKTELDEGSYILVPLSTGALLQKPITANDDPIDFSVVNEGIKMPHPFFLTTINDIFRKIDLKLNGKLSAEELNQFGKIINEPKFKNITDKSFKKKEFKKLSCDSEGLTNLGFKQFLFRNFEQDKLEEMFDILGYDRGLYSLKSKIFVTSFQADTDIRVKINDSFLGNFQSRAWDLFMNYKLENGEHSEDFVKSKMAIFFSVRHPNCYGCSYAVANNSKKWIKVELDMTKSTG